MTNNNLTDERLELFAEIAAQNGFFDATTGEVEAMVTELRERRQADKNFFMYGIADPDGCAHMDEFCVSSDKGLLEVTADELNLNEGTDGYRVVALYTALPLTDSEREELQQYRKAAMQQEPVAWLNDAYLGRGVVDGEAGSEDQGPGYIPVYREPYTALLAPMAPDERQSLNNGIVGFDEGWNACRAAMLNGGKS